MYRINPCDVDVELNENERFCPPNSDSRLGNFMNLFNCEAVNDVTFEVGNLETGIEYISGSRTIFAAHSQVFKQMLFGPIAMIESKSRKSKNIILNDISPDTFKIVKEYCYGKDMWELFCRYDVDRQKNDGIKVDLAEILFFSDKYLFTTLRARCIGEIVQNYILPACHSQELLEILNKLHDYKLYHILIKILSSHRESQDSEKNKTSLLGKIVTDCFVYRLKPQVLQLIVFNFESGREKQMVSQEWLWKSLVRYCKQFVSYLRNDKMRDDVAYVSTSEEKKHDIDCDFGDSDNVKWQDIMIEYFKDYIIYEHMSFSFYLSNVLTTGIHDKKEIASVIAYLTQKQAKHLSLRKENNDILSHRRQWTKCDCKDSNGNDTNEHKQPINISRRFVRYYSTCFIKTYDYISGIDHYCHRLFSSIAMNSGNLNNIDENPIYYAIETLSNVKYHGKQTPESRSDCIKMGMIDQLKHIQNRYLNKINNSIKFNYELDAVERLKILLTLDNVVFFLTDIGFGSGIEIFTNAIIIITERLKCLDDQVFLKTCLYLRQIIDECVDAIGEKEDSNTFNQYFPAELNGSDARMIVRAIIDVVDLKYLVNMLIKMTDNINIDNLDDPHDTIYLFRFMSHIIVGNAYIFDSCETIDELVFDLNIFRVFENLLAADTDDTLLMPIVCNIESILVYGSSKCMDVALNKSNIFGYLMDKLSYKTKMEKPNHLWLSDNQDNEKENEQENGTAEEKSKTMRLFFKMRIINCLVSVLNGHNVTWEQCSQCIDIGGNNDFKLIPICIDLLEKICSQIKNKRDDAAKAALGYAIFDRWWKDIDEDYGYVSTLIKFLDLHLQVDAEMDTKKCENVIRKQKGFQLV